jgi:hypothetical protein
MEVQQMKELLNDKKGQLTIGDGPRVVLTVGLIFLIMATVALVAEEYGDSLTENSTAYNVTVDLAEEVEDNTSLAGVVLTIALVGIILTVLIGIFVGFTRRGV